MKTSGYLRLLVAAALGAFALLASEHHGVVNLAGLPVPGATVTATQGDKKVVAITDGMGSYSFPDLADGTWTVQVEMSGFTPLKEDVTVGPNAPASTWKIKIKSFSDIQAQVQATPLEARPEGAAAANTARPIPPANSRAKPAIQAAAQAGGRGGAPAPAAAEAAPPVDESSQRAADGFLVNGSQTNGGASPFALNPAFGNNRRGPRSLYTYLLSITEANSALNARPFSTTGADTVKPETNQLTVSGSVQGPLRIPRIFRANNAPTVFLQYQIGRNTSGSTSPALMPTEAQREGNLSNFTGQIFDPTTGLPFAGNIIPTNRISPQATALLSLFPLPNFTGSSLYNYQIPLVGASHTDSVQTRITKSIGRKNSLQIPFALTSTRGSNPSVFGFLDNSSTLGMNFAPLWRHQWTPRMSSTFQFTYNRSATHAYSFWENRANISGMAGITGNNQQPVYWGPPALSFGGTGFQPLSDTNPSFLRPQRAILQTDNTWNHGRHNVTFGADIRRDEQNIFSQNNPRGAFTFNGYATGASATVPGYGFADFLLGIPDNATLAFGNADKYLRATGYDAYVADDWRVNSALTVNANLRYEYNAPYSEEYGRLVNLAIGPGYSTAVPVCGAPIANVCAGSSPSSLIRPERFPFGPGIGIAWRPISGSSLVVRAGYSLRFSPPNYAGYAGSMDQQSPLSTSLAVANTAAVPLTLANGFIGSPQFSADQYAFNVNFKEAYAQNWTITIQKDLPGGMQMQVGYNGIKGTRMPQLFYPNTYPVGGTNPCPTCPSGFSYQSSNGDSTREAGTLNLRRRLHAGFQAGVQYTYAKAIDDTGTAQNWLNLSGERGLSNFDQRHNAQITLQYTSGTGIGGGSLISGWRAVALKEWTLQVPIMWGTGLPETPTFTANVAGTGVTGPLRPDYTGAPLYLNSSTRFLNPAAFMLPPSGQYGNVPVGAITGPDQFTISAALQRTFRISDRISLDLRINAVNPINHPVVTGYNTTWAAEGSQFGAPQGYSGMRNVSTLARFRF